MLDLLRLVKRLFNILFGRDKIFPVQTRIPTERHGEKHACWTIASDRIDARSIIYSFGIGTDISFDLSLIEKYNVQIHAFDPTPQSIAWLEQQSLPKEFHYYAYGLAGSDGTVDFFPPTQEDHISHSILPVNSTEARSIKVQVNRLETIMKRLNHNKIDLIKMDIEGAEYVALADILNSEITIDQILVEFHHRFATIQLARTRETINQLNRTGYKIFYASPFGEDYCFIKT